MASDEERTPKFVPLDESDDHRRNETILFGFENELKSVTIRQGDSARFEAKLRLLSTSSTVPIDRSLLKIEWRLNDRVLSPADNPRYHFDSILDQNLFWMDIRHCEQEDEGVYTLSISYDHGRFEEESSAYLFVDSE